jgi:DNA-binding HxlR family transcriptional regulator
MPLPPDPVGSFAEAEPEPAPSPVGGLPGQRVLPAWEDPHLRALLHRLGDRWSVAVVLVLLDGPRGFNRLMAALSGVSHKVLTSTLRSLQHDGLVSRTVQVDGMLRVTYALTPLGETLREPLATLQAWAGAHHADVAAAREASARGGAPIGAPGEEADRETRSGQPARRSASDDSSAPATRSRSPQASQSAASVVGSSR